MKKNKAPFSLEDFEKGLMLAGYFSPINLSEINERSILIEYEREKSKENQSIYFRRVVLAAEIVYQLHTEFTFGRVKFQKLVFLCENACNMELNQRYTKFAAGPFDNRFMHSINKEFKRLKWFDVKIRVSGDYRVPVYSKSENVEKYKNYYQNMYGEFDYSIQKIIETFRKQKTRQVELVATIYSCILEIFKDKKTVTEENLIKLFYSWAKEKKKFSKKEILQTLKWMIENKIMPIK